MIHRHEDPKSVDLLAALCRELFALAKHEDDVAAEEASQLPYWVPCPPSVVGHRAAARTLRAEAQRLEAAMRPLATAS
ncbi:hypothetical protein [Nocardioides sp.]|uniref:hypothetical protein n=1 Tax=Nocardioides sp. TaxID=35761 RepID=UPI002D19AFBE|nr:hypothetical protein [Nocardioides sp.]HSX68683.1 hypothetical protein [Nocardioides sp.]